MWVFSVGWVLSCGFFRGFIVKFLRVLLRKVGVEFVCVCVFVFIIVFVCVRDFFTY